MLRLVITCVLLATLLSACAVNPDGSLRGPFGAHIGAKPFMAPIFSERVEIGGAVRVMPKTQLPPPQPD